MSKLTGVVMVSVFAVGCAGNALKLGSDEDGGVSTLPGVIDCSNATSAATVSDYAAPDACVTGNEQLALVGKWDGYFQGTGFSDEQTTFHLNVMGANSTKGLCGTILFGTQTVAKTIPAATDPTAFYPPAELNLSTSLTSLNTMPTPGFQYTLLNGRVDGQRVRFDLAVNEIFNSWCALQTSYAATTDCQHFMCVPNWAGRATTDTSTGKYDSCFLTDPRTNQEHQFSCAQMLGCSAMAVCDCDETHCVGGRTLGINSFDLVFNGDQATGVGASFTTILNRVQ